MKYFIYVMIVLLSACTSSKKENANDLGSLKKSLSEKENQMSKLKQEISVLQGKISKLDTTTNFKKILVSTQTLALEKFVHSINVQGRITGDELLNVSPQVPAIYAKIYVVKGSIVTKGQLLATLDDNVLRQGMQELTSGISFAKTVYDKQKALWDQKIGSEIQYLTAKNNLDALNKKMSTMNQQMAMYKLKSPISGVVDDVFAREGEMGSPGMPSIKVVNLKTLKVVANLAEVNVDKVKVGNKVDITFPDLNKTIHSTVKTVGKVINDLNRTFTVDVALPTSSEYRPNMLCVVKIIDYANDAAISIPINAVVRSDNKEYVYAVENENGTNKAVKKLIDLGLYTDNEVEVKSGLKPGEKIITVGYQDVNNGDAVEISK